MIAGDRAVNGEICSGTIYESYIYDILDATKCNGAMLRSRVTMTYIAASHPPVRILSHLKLAYTGHGNFKKDILSTPYGSAALSSRIMRVHATNIVKTSSLATKHLLRKRAFNLTIN